MKVQKILGLAAYFSLTKNAGAQVKLQWQQDIGQGLMRAVLRRDDSLRLPLYELPRNTLGWTDGSIGTPAQDMELLFSIFSSDVVVAELGSQLCTAKGSNCSYAGAFSPDKSSTFKALGEEYGQLTANSPVNQTGKFFKDTLRIGGVDLEDFRMALLDELHIDPTWGGSFSFFDWTPIVGIGPGSSALDAMVEKGVIKSTAYSMWQDNSNESSSCFKPAGATNCSPKTRYGTVLLGAVDKSKYDGGLISIDMTTEQEGAGLPWNGHHSIVLDAVTTMSLEARDVQSKDIPISVRDEMTFVSLLPDSIVSQIWDAFGVVVPAIDSPNVGFQAGRVPCDPTKRNKTSAGSIKLRLGGKCGPELEVPFDDLVGAADDPDFFGAEMHPGPEGGEQVAWCLFNIQKVGGGLSTPSGDELPAAISAVVWKNAYVVYDFDNGKMAIAKKKDASEREDVVVFEGKGKKIPGSFEIDADDKTSECKRPAEPGGGSGDSGADDAKSAAFKLIGVALNHVKWAIVIPSLALAEGLLF